MSEVFVPKERAEAIIAEFAEPKEYANAKRAEARIIELEFDYRTDMTAQALRIAEQEAEVERLREALEEIRVHPSMARHLASEALEEK